MDGWHGWTGLGLTDWLHWLAGLSPLFAGALRLASRKFPALAALRKREGVLRARLEALVAALADSEQLRAAAPRSASAPYPTLSPALPLPLLCPYPALLYPFPTPPPYPLSLPILSFPVLPLSFPSLPSLSNPSHP